MARSRKIPAARAESAATRTKRSVRRCLILSGALPWRRSAWSRCGSGAPGRPSLGGLEAGRAEAVAEAAHRLDPGADRAQLRPQPLHVRVDGARLEIAAVPPALAQALLAAAGAPGAAGQPLEQLELGAGEAELLAPDPDGVGLEIDHQRIVDDSPLLRLRLF